MKIYILHQDVSYEFGVVLGVYSSPGKAEAALEEATITKHHPGAFPPITLGIDRGELDVEEWEVD